MKRKVYKSPNIDVFVIDNEDSIANSSIVNSAIVRPGDTEDGIRIQFEKGDDREFEF